MTAGSDALALVEWLRDQVLADEEIATAAGADTWAVS